MTKKELISCPDYTWIKLNGIKLVKHGNYLHTGNYFSHIDDGINISKLKETDVIERI